MKQVSRKEWANTPRGYKSVKENGQKMMLVYNAKQGTMLVPVEVVEGV